jgi:hypothetical protein
LFALNTMHKDHNNIRECTHTRLHPEPAPKRRSAKGQSKGCASTLSARLVQHKVYDNQLVERRAEKRPEC